MSDDIPVPAWKQRRPPPRRRPALSREVIIDAALQLLDAEGLEGVSMRRVAEELGTGPASLYAHVANKEDLLDLLHDRVVGEIPVPEPDPKRWQEQIREIAMDTFRVYGAHRDVALIAMANIPTGPNALRLAEVMLEIMIIGGVPPEVAAYAIDRLALYISADAYEGTLFYQRRSERGQTVEDLHREYFDKIREFYTSLPPQRFPYLTANVNHLMSGTSELRFEFGLDMLIRSLATYVPSRADPPST